jgi:hypothetical protein
LELRTSALSCNVYVRKHQTKQKTALQTGYRFASAVVRLLSLAFNNEKVAALLSKPDIITQPAGGEKRCNFTVWPTPLPGVGFECLNLFAGFSSDITFAARA